MRKSGPKGQAPERNRAANPVRSGLRARGGAGGAASASGNDAEMSSPRVGPGGAMAEGGRIAVGFGASNDAIAASAPSSPSATPPPPPDKPISSPMTVTLELAVLERTEYPSCDPPNPSAEALFS